MYISLTAEEVKAIRDFAVESSDCELIGEREAVLDLYDLEPPVTLDLVLDPKGARVDGAAYMAFDEELDGWYMDEPIKNEAEIRRALAETWKKKS